MPRMSRQVSRRLITLGCGLRDVRQTVPCGLPVGHPERRVLVQTRAAGDHARSLSSAASRAEKARKAALERAAARRTEGLPSPRRQGLPPSLLSAQRQVDSQRPIQNTDEHGGELLEHHPLVTTAGQELVLSPPALVVTREYEWGNIVFGFEQANRYTIRAAPGGEIVGYIAEEDSIGKSITRNILRTHRSFKATILDKNGKPVFIIRRPFYVFSTSLYVDEAGENGLNLGMVKMSWHMWRRRYGLYVDQRQFAEIDSGFLAVDFAVRDEEGRRIASVNKDFTGFAREIFTDARQYVLRLDPSFNMTAAGLVNDPATVSAGGAESVDGDQLLLTMKQRAVLLASAISIDFDYFSLHSRGGLGPGGMFMPMPIPGTGAGAGGSPGDAGGGADAGGIGDSGAPEGTAGTAGPSAGSDWDTGAVDGGMGPGVDAPGAPETNSDWATFEQPDYGFQEDPSESMDDPWSAGSDSASGGGFFGGDGGGGGIGGDDDEGSGNLIISLIRRIFWNDD